MEVVFMPLLPRCVGERRRWRAVRRRRERRELRRRHSGSRSLQGRKRARKAARSGNRPASRSASSASASSASQARSWASASSSTMTCRPDARRRARAGLEGAPIGRAREQLIAVDQVEQRHGLAAQRVDDVAVVDDVAALAVRDRPAAPQRHHRRHAEEAFEPVVDRDARAGDGRSAATARCRTLAAG